MVKIFSENNFSLSSKREKEKGFRKGQEDCDRKKENCGGGEPEYGCSD